MAVVSVTPRQQRRLLPLASWTAALATLLVALSRLDGGVGATPSLRAPATWDEWASARPPVEMAFALLRLVVVVLAWYLAGTTAVGVVARLSRCRPLVAAADALTVPAVRHLLHGALGLGLTTAALVASREATAVAAVGMAAVSVEEPAAPPVMRRLDPADPGVATMRRLPDDPSTEAATPGQAWRVEPGQHLWSIADEVLTRAWGRPPSDGELVPYWRTLIDVNRPALADPANPDLIFPGQVFQVPPPPAA